jgi:hypothetical protein
LEYLRFLNFLFIYSTISCGKRVGKHCLKHYERGD